jgi:hypothetical protein
MTVDKRYHDVLPEMDAARIVVSGSDAAASGTRLCYGCAVDPSDIAAAEEAAAAKKGHEVDIPNRARVIVFIYPNVRL